MIVFDAPDREFCIVRRATTNTPLQVMTPCEDRASNLYRRFFLHGNQEEVEHQVERLKLGASIMD